MEFPIKPERVRLDAGPVNPTPGPFWLRVLVGRKVARRRDIRGLPLLTVFSLVWWRIGLTPTARFRLGRFRESMVDNRGPTFAVRVARQSAPPGR